MISLRHWSVRHAGFLERSYARLWRLAMVFEPAWRRLGYGRLEAPVAALERGLKGLLFDCRMCGRCILGATGMACPMNCPKELRNGPCGGVRPDGGCEIEPAMRCVWVEAWEGSRRMAGAAARLELQGPLDHSLVGTSAWLREAREEGVARGDTEPAP